MSDSITWYAVYDCEFQGGRDTDYQGFATRDEAVAHARTYLDFCTAATDDVFVVPLADDSDQTDFDDERSLWDDMHTIPASDFIWLKRSGRYDATDIVDDLRGLADGQNDHLGSILTRAADEIERLRNQG